MLNKKLSAILIFFLSLHGNDVIVEFKGAGFFPTDNVYRKIYGYGGIYGPELTFNIGPKDWYAFASIQFLHQNGKSLGLDNPTKINLLALGVGLKYLIPFCYGNFYIGLGFQPVCIKTKDYSPFVIFKHKKWSFGGIGKSGLLFYLSHDFVFDIFLDYSFIQHQFKKSQAPTGFVQPRKTNVSGFIFGAGIGYYFN
jgi:hypothetical protein